MEPGPKPLESEIQNFSHGRDFLVEAVKYLGEKGIQPEYGKNYYIHPGVEAYGSFLNFIIEELERLPFDNQVGRTIKMREDAREVVGRLIEYFKNKLKQATVSGQWTKDDVAEIEDIFGGYNLEVFKNEIYPKHDVEGIGYNIDLSRGRGNTPSEVILERRFVTNQDGFKVLDHGFFKLNVQNGTISMDLEEFPTRNVHLGD